MYISLEKRFGFPVTKELSDSDGVKTLKVTGMFTSDTVDAVGDIITKDATVKAADAYRQWGNLRLMHEPIPVGKMVRMGEQDGLAWNEIEFEVIDPKAIFLVEHGLVKAFSVGILVDQYKINDAGGLLIENYKLAEISLVDHPANYDAKITTTKGVAILDKAMRQRLKKLGPEDGLDKIFEEEEMSEETQTADPVSVVPEAPAEQQLPAGPDLSEFVSKFEAALTAMSTLITEQLKDLGDKISVAAQPAEELPTEPVAELPERDFDKELSELRQQLDEQVKALANAQAEIADLNKKLEAPAPRTNTVVSVEIDAPTPEESPLNKALTSRQGAGSVIIQPRM